jgi:hypothetical protein
VAANENAPEAGRFVVPNDRQRITIIGKTGSGKTQAAAYLLAHRSYTTQPWIIFDYKYEDLLGSIPGTREIGIDEKVPKHPGLYITHPGPADKEAAEAMMWRIWQREHVGVFIDEGYMIPRDSPAFQAILTQGRSKRIPVIMLTQRPAWVSRFAFSEADYIQCFQLTDRRDQKTVREFMPCPLEVPLPAPYYSWWWDNGRNFKTVLRPVPKENTILDTFHGRLFQRKRVI